MKEKHNKNKGWQSRDPQHERESSRYEHPVPSRELILAQLGRHAAPVTFSELTAEFALEQERDVEAFRRRLGAMIRDGQVVQDRRGSYGLTAKMDLVHGTVIGHRDGFGFLQPDAGGEDVFLSPRQMRAVLHGDRALVRITGTDARGRREGTLVDVLERRTKSVVGRYAEERGVGIVIPDNTRISQDILIPPADRGGAHHGQIVTAEIVQAPDKRTQPIGRIVEILGEHMAPGMEIEIAIRSHGLPHVWPAAVEQEVAGLAPEVGEEQKQDRLDLRRMPLVTIDGVDARDFDDAVYCEPDGRGWKLWVAIADVASYVRPDTALDAEAKERGNSVYFPQQVIPMLPEILSNGLCSLNPDVDRLCMVCEMHVGRKGEVSGACFHNAVMRSHARLTYEQVARMLANPEEAGRFGRAEILPHLQSLQAVFHALFDARQRRGAIDFESEETRIIFGADRKIEAIEPVERNEAHRIIEECMIAANVQASLFLEKHRMATLYRVHSGPEADRLAALREFLAGLGLSLGGGENPQPQHYAKLLGSVKDRPDARLIQTVMLRSLAQAVYSPDTPGHFGLALESYAHFTSPIRRYPDLIVHRGLKQVLQRKKADNSDDGIRAMRELGVHCSMTERRADEATRDAVTWLKCEYMQEHLGATFDGIVTGVVPFGLFVMLDRVYVEGLVHVSSLPGDYWHHDARAHCLRGERSGRVWRLGDRMRAKVARVNLDERKIDFEPVLDRKDQERRPDRRKPKRNRRKR